MRPETEKIYFELRFDFMCDMWQGHTHIDVRNSMVEYIKNHHPECIEIIEVERYREIKQPKFWFDNQGNPVCFYGYKDGKRYYSVNLYQPIIVDYKQSKGVFRVLFECVFEKAEHPATFLDYHFNLTFDGNIKEYQQFLTNKLTTRNELKEEWLKQNFD